MSFCKLSFMKLYMYTCTYRYFNSVDAISGDAITYDLDYGEFYLEEGSYRLWGYSLVSYYSDNRTEVDPIDEDELSAGYAQINGTKADGEMVFLATGSVAVVNYQLPSSFDTFITVEPEDALAITLQVNEPGIAPK